MKDLNEQFFDHEILVEARILYCMEDFNTYTTIRLNHKPQTPTLVSLIFVRTKEKMHKIKVAFGYEDAPFGIDNSAEGTNYSNVLTFENRLVKEVCQVGEDKIENLD